MRLVHRQDPSPEQRGHFLVLESTPEMSGVGTPSLVGEIGWA